MIKNILCVWCEKHLAIQNFDPKIGREKKLECSPPCADNPGAVPIYSNGNFEPPSPSPSPKARKSAFMM